MFALAVIMIFSLCACGSNPSADDIDDNASANASDKVPPTTNDKGETSLVFTQFCIPPTLDTGSVNEFNATRINYMVYDFLVDKDNQGNWVPSIATSWEQVDSMTWKFEISDQFVFQNGEPLEMDDIIFSFERLKTAPAAAVYASKVASASYEDRVVTFTLVEEDNSIIPQLVNGMFIVDKSYVEEVGEDALNNKPIGTGPYAVTFYDPATKAVLHTWEGYPFEKPAIDEITVTTGADSSVRYIQLETGEASLAGQMSYLDFQRAEEDGRFECKEYADVGVAAIKFNVTKPPFDNKNLRLALAYALDRETFCSISLGAVPAYSMVASALPEYSKASTVPEYNLDKAVELLAAEGYSTSNPLEFTVTTFMNETALEAYQSVLSSIGVNMHINAVNSGSYSEAESTKNYDALFSRYINRSCSAMEEVMYYVSWGNKNTTGFANAEIDALGKEILSSTDQAVIKEDFAKLQELAGAEMHMLPICTPHSWYIYHKNVSGLDFLPNGLFFMENASYN